MQTKKRAFWRGYKANIDEQNIIIFDTNILLNMYFIDDLEYIGKFLYTIESNIWTPHQIYYEFCRDRSKKIYEIRNRVDDLVAFESKIKKYTDNRLKEYENLPSKYGKIIREQVSHRMEGVEEYLGNIKDELIMVKKRVGQYTYENNDIYYALFKDTIFSNTGTEYSTEEKLQIEKEAEERYEKKIPPGYMDNKKKENKYGDYIIWRQIIDKSINENKDIIFVSNDIKEDWRGKDGGCRFELIQEFNKLTGKNFNLLTLNEFVERVHYNGSIEECLYQLRELDNNNWKRDTSWKEKYPYYEKLNKITLDRRGEYYLKNGTDDIAYEALRCIRAFLEYKFNEIFCTDISMWYYSMSMEVFIKEGQLLKKVCRVNYKANNCFTIAIDIDEQKCICVVKQNDNIEPSEEYIRETIKHILNYMFKENLLSRYGESQLGYTWENIDTILEEYIF